MVDIVFRVNPFNFNCLEEAFSHRIIPAITFPAHAPGYPNVCIEDIDELLASILDPPIRVKDQILGNGSLSSSHQPGRDNGLHC